MEPRSCSQLIIILVHFPSRRSYIRKLCLSGTLHKRALPREGSPYRAYTKQVKGSMDFIYNSA